MLNRVVPSSFLIAGILSLTVADARADDPCFGPWMYAAQLPRPDGSIVEWGDPSTCNCGIGTRVEGGVYVSGKEFGWLWSAGYGEVRVQLEMEWCSVKPSSGISLCGGWSTEPEYVNNLSTGKLFAGKNGGGSEGAMALPKDKSWTGYFRAVCFPGR